jgi:thiol-disulfide isomerase/thioredoxin
VRKLLFLIALTGFMVSTATVRADEVTLKTVNYQEMGQIIRGHKGKVVIVDFWRYDCAPCKKGYPHLVELHKNHAADGLVIISVHLDTPIDKDLGRAKVEEKAREFLGRVGATFTNLLLDEPSDVWTKKLDINAVPCVFVFNRDNRWEAKFTDAGEAAENLDKLVEKLLKK